MNETVSVIIPVYNRQDVIQECVQSILVQSYKQIEVILVDDGSSDRTVEIWNGRMPGSDCWKRSTAACPGPEMPASRRPPAISLPSWTATT